jgi:hypothetical protein
MVAYHSKHTIQVGWDVALLGLYLGGVQFKSQLGHRLS